MADLDIRTRDEELVMNLANTIDRAEKVVRRNSPAILTGFGVSGTIVTAYLAGVASYRAANDPHGRDRELDRKETIRLVWKRYIPAGISGAVTIGCIIGATGTANRRTAAAASAYTVTERAFSEYRDKVIDQIGETKEQKVRDELAADHIASSPPKNSEILVTGNGNVLCCRALTRSDISECDMETLRRAQNDVNAKILQELYVPLSDFYYLVGLPVTTNSSEIGWNSDKLMELEFSTVLTEDGRPCLSFEYNYVKPI